MNHYELIKEQKIAKIFYTNKNKKTFEAIIDIEDFEKCKKKKWRFSNGYFVTGNGINNNKVIALHNFILNNEQGIIADHKNGDKLNNTKNNLRKCKQKHNCYNKNLIKSNSNFLGISYNNKRKKYEPMIAKEKIKYHLGRYNLLEEAVYARFIAENVLFKNFRSKINNSKIYQQNKLISLTRKKEIKKYIVDKINCKKYLEKEGI